MSNRVERAPIGRGVDPAAIRRAYGRLAGTYDLLFGPLLDAGRARALQQLQLAPGASVIEIGVGTCITCPQYPASCRVVGIDLSTDMLRRAQQRVATRDLRNVTLLSMDAEALAFASGVFDAVYAPYVMSVVENPLLVAQELQRVCKPGGRIVILNHFVSRNGVLGSIETALGPWCRWIGFRPDLDLDRFLEQSGLRAESIEKVNVPSLWSLVTCINRG